MYSDIPLYENAHEDIVWQGRRGSASSSEDVRSRQDDCVDHDRPQRANMWQEDIYDSQPNSAGIKRSFPGRANPSDTFDSLENRSRTRATIFGDDYSYSKPERPTVPKQAYLGASQAIAMFTFDPDQPGDLDFKKGDIITITEKPNNEIGWWIGRIGDREGIFPSNYVEIIT